MRFHAHPHLTSPFKGEEIRREEIGGEDPSRPV